MKQILVAALVLASVPALAAPKPGLEGSYEMVSFRTKTQPETQIAPMMLEALKSYGTVWARIVVTFDGPNMTITSQQLIGKPGAYTACVASATAGVTWKGKTFTLAGKLVGTAAYTTFSKLTSTDTDEDTNHCNASIEGGTYTVAVKGDQVMMSRADGTVTTLATSADAVKPEWHKHLPKK